VYQLETAMGAAIDVFEGAQAIEVPRSRFAPVKTTNDLLVVRSDAYELTSEMEMRLVRDEPPLVDLDPRYYKLLRDFDARFPAGPPSLKECDRLEVHGDVVFGRDVVIRGSVRIEGDRRIEDGAVVEGDQ
jgi:UTP--glucose-1-phosphate uridylyltransferase